MNNSKQPIKSFTDLTAWQKSHELSLLIYKITRSFTQEEKFALIDQLRRAAVSSTSNIAEGFSRNTSKDKAQFYTIAIGSMYEIQSQIMLARDLGYISTDIFNSVYKDAVSAARLTSKLKSSTYKLSDYSPNSQR